MLIRIVTALASRRITISRWWENASGWGAPTLADEDIDDIVMC